jgi:hypothetical protein
MNAASTVLAVVGGIIVGSRAQKLEFKDAMTLFLGYALAIAGMALK